MRTLSYFITPIRVIIMALVLLSLHKLESIGTILSDQIPDAVKSWWTRAKDANALLRDFDSLMEALWLPFALFAHWEFKWLFFVIGNILLVAGIGWMVVQQLIRYIWPSSPDLNPSLGLRQVLVAEALVIEQAKLAKYRPGETDRLERALEKLKGSAGKDGGANPQDTEDKVPREVYQRLNQLNRSALCFSGGGIRTATFGLGVLQALASKQGKLVPDNEQQDARQKSDGYQDPTANSGRPARTSLLGQFDYLSTVSGGGFIGGWLLAWIKREKFDNVWQGLTGNYGDVKSNRLTDSAGQTSVSNAALGAEHEAVKWIRDNSSWLAPRLGLTSPDTLALVAIYVRNLVLNWLVLLPVLCALLIVMKLSALSVYAISLNHSGPLFLFFALLGLTMLFSALRFTLRQRPSQYDKTNMQPDQAKVVRGMILPHIGAAFCFTLCLAIGAAAIKQNHSEGRWISELLSIVNGNFALQRNVVIGAACGAVLYVLVWISSWSSWASWWSKKARGPTYFLRWTFSGAIYGGLIALVAYWFSRNYFEDMIFGHLIGWFIQLVEGKATSAGGAFRHVLVLILLGVPLFLTAHLIGEMIYVGLSSHAQDSDQDREWLGRSGGLFILAALAWLGLMYLTYVGAHIAYTIIEAPGISAAFFLVLWAIAAIIIRYASSASTPANPQDTNTARAGLTVLASGGIICVVLLITVASALIDLAVLDKGSIADLGRKALDKEISTYFVSLITALGVVLLIGFVAARHVNINRFSLHDVWRNRMVRTFLGATYQYRNRERNRERKPFVDLVKEYNLPIHTLWPKSDREDHRPFHIVNTTVNATESEHPSAAAQARAAFSFTMSPLHCGSEVTRFRPSEQYGGKGGISLGTAMAISGAAFSPNMGYYHGSTAVSLMLTLFNARMGSWLGNPSHSESYKEDGPSPTFFSPLFAELLHMSSVKDEYIYLSDGGHFENLALYEMVRRRCRLIVVSDGGADPDFACAELGLAVAKIRIDFGIPITFRGLDALRKRPDRVAVDIPYHAIGVIDYAAADGGDSQKGVILYIKPAFHSDVISADVRAYALENPDFPHESTLDQWYGESKFESYRQLGFEIMGKVLSDVLPASGGKLASPSSLYHALLEKYSVVPATGSAKHSPDRTSEDRVLTDAPAVNPQPPIDGKRPDRADLPPSSGAGSMFESELKRGDEGSYVRRMQTALLLFGLTPSASGIFDNETEYAVTKFQGSCKLPTDGIVGERTKIALVQEALNRHGSNLQVDGTIGRLTKAAVTQFQGKCGLVVDGNVGKQTWDALFPE
ncbi:MAG: peptidoglycan-binding domain-containing protein [Hyphomicrobiaceae bacterium]